MNVVLILILILGYILVVHKILFGKMRSDLESFEEDTLDKYSIEYLKDSTVQLLDDTLQTDYSSLNLNKYEQLKCERNQDKLRQCLKTCSCGDLLAKQYVKDFIADLLQRKLNITETTINSVIPFTEEDKLSVIDKFEILIYLYERKYNAEGFSMFILENGLNDPHGDGSALHYVVVDSDICDVFTKMHDKVESLSFYDKLSILTQRVYELSYGLGAIDTIRYMNIDGFNAGTSGIPDTMYLDGELSKSVLSPIDSSLPLFSFNAIWAMFHGVQINLRFLGFESQKELVRVCKRIYKYNNPGALDAAHPKIVNFTKDGCRITVARPPMAESWMFFLRKFGSAPRTLKSSYPYKGLEKLIEIIKWIVLGNMNIAVTGGQGCGKTSFLKMLPAFMRATEALRVQEMAFETELRKSYPYMNIATFAETPTVSAEEEIEFSRKSDGTASMFGEIAQAAVAALAIQMGQVGAGQIYFTNHAITTSDLVEYFRDALIEKSGYTNEKLVEELVSKVINFDIHLVNIGGKRILERITMIEPLVGAEYPEDVDDARKEYYYRQTDRPVFRAIDILQFKNDEFVYCNSLSKDMITKLEHSLRDFEIPEFRDWIKRVKADVNGEVIECQITQ